MQYAWTNAALRKKGYRFGNGDPVYSDGVSREISEDKSRECVVFEASRDRYKAQDCNKWRNMNTICREIGKAGELIALFAQYINNTHIQLYF